MKNKNIFIILIAISLLSIIPLLHKGFFVSDDGEWMIIRFSAFHQALVSGQFPVRFLPRLYFGYGYPVANFLYPGFMYLAEIPKLLKISFANSIKIILGFSMIFSSLFSFLWLSKKFDKISSFFGALIYLYTPYHLFDLYKRGSVGEILSFSVLPFVLWQIERGDVFWISIGFSLLLIAHNTLAILFGLIIFLYSLLKVVENKNKKVMYQLVCSAIFGFGISAFFWLPAIYDLQFTIFSKTNVSDYAKYFANFELVGLSALLIFSAVIVLHKKIKQDSFSKMFLTLGVLSTFFAIGMSNPLWKIMPTSVIQFPFRFLSVTTVSLSYLLASILGVMPQKKKLAFGAVVLLIALFSSRRYMMPSQYVDRDGGFYSTNEDSTTVQNEYLPKWVQVKAQERSINKIELSSGILSLGKTSASKYIFSVSSEKDTDVTIHTFYFPGWGILVNGKKMDLKIDKYGQIHFMVKKGVSFVTVYFSETPLRAFADLVSLASFLSLIIFRLKYKNGKSN